MAKVRRDSKDPLPSAENSARVGGGNVPYPAGAEKHNQGKGERVSDMANRTTGPTAEAVAQPTRQNGDGNTPVSGESHNQKKAQKVPASARW